jgi:hypothetical protein
LKGSSRGLEALLLHALGGFGGIMLALYIGALLI